MGKSEEKINEINLEFKNDHCYFSKVKGLVLIPFLEWITGKNSSTSILY